MFDLKSYFVRCVCAVLSSVCCGYSRLLGLFCLIESRCLVKAARRVQVRHTYNITSLSRVMKNENKA